MPVSRRIESTTSRTAEMTCLCRAASTLEKRPFFKSDDYIAPILLPRGIRFLLRIPMAWRLIDRLFVPEGIYEYVIARTKYIDEVLAGALDDGFGQVLVFGAGFDTRGLRFRASMDKAEAFELDSAVTQEAKIRQYRERGLTVPSNLHFISIDFDKDSLAAKLEAAGFRRGRRSLFVLEGLLMYLQPESVHSTLEVIREYAGSGSRLVFDYIYASVLRGEADRYGERGIVQTTSRADERWQFGIESGQIGSFLAAHSMRVVDHKTPQELEKAYFTDSRGRCVGRINGTHCIVTAEVH